MSQNVTFLLGGPKRPAGMTHDNGFGPRKRLPTGEEILKYNAIKETLNVLTNPVVNKIMDVGIAVNSAIPNPALVRLRSLPDALGAFRHFIMASGTDRQVDFDSFLDDDQAGRALKLNVRYLARKSAEQIYENRFQSQFRSGSAVSFSMTSSVIAMNEGDGGDFMYPATENWQKTLGAHYVWISARVNVTYHHRASSGPLFFMELTFHAEDRYNFNPTKNGIVNQDIASGTPDSKFGVFEENGLAKAYMNYGLSVIGERWIGRTTNTVQVHYDLPGTW